MKSATDSPEPRAGSDLPTSPTAGTPGWLFPLLLLVTLAAYWPALRGALLWDDIGHVTAPELQSWSGLLRIWGEPGATQQYYPLLHSAFWVEHRLWGDATLGYHLVNVAWHALSACLLVVLLRRLAVPGALFAGFLFALHPVCVESVAWISEQKNALSTVFYLTAALAWLRFDEERKPARYVVATLWFLAALLTKSVTATLPAALLVVVWWRRGGISWRRDVLPLLPWLAFGVAAGLGTAWLEATQIGASGGDFALSAVERGMLAGRVVWFYLGKLVWPEGLSFFYERWTISAGQAWQWLYPAAVVLVLVGFFLWRKRSRGPLAAALLFGGTLVPVLGFVNVYPFVFSYVADHFQYLACLGMLAFLAAVSVRGVQLLRLPRWAGTALALGVLLTLGSLTWRQSGMYRNDITLYEATLERTPTSWVAHLNLGTALDEAGRSAEGLVHLQRARELKPNFAETLNSLGNVLNRLGRSPEALQVLQQAVQLQPRFAEAHNTLGVTLMALGRSAEGIASFQRAVELRPGLALARANLGWAFANQQRHAEAIAQFEQALVSRPDFAEAEYKWGLTLAMNRKPQEALPHFERASDLQPERADIHFTMAAVHAQLGNEDEAVAQLQETLRLAPNHAGAREALTLIMKQRSQ